MTKRKRKLPRKSLQEQVGGPNFYGTPSFGGTRNFGKGGVTQLVNRSLDPAVQVIKKQEEDENNQNVDDTAVRLGKYGLGPRPDSPGPVPSWDENPRNLTEKFLDSLTQEEEEEDRTKTVVEGPAYDNSTSRMRDLPGFPRMNTLVHPKGFVPRNDFPENEEPYTGRKAEYMGPTVNGRQITNYSGQLPQEEARIQPPRSVEDEVDQFLGALAPEGEDGRDPDEDENLILQGFVETIVRETLHELLGAPRATYPSRQGWNNSQLNSLVWRKNQMSPADPAPDMWHQLFKEPRDLPSTNLPADKTPLGGMGAIGYPKQFVPTDFETDEPDAESVIHDPLGSKRLQTLPDEDAPRVGVNSSISENNLKSFLLQRVLGKK